MSHEAAWFIYTIFAVGIGLHAINGVEKQLKRIADFLERHARDH